MTDEALPVAVLRDYPLRLWVEQNEYFEGLLREYRLLLEGEVASPERATPRRLVELATELADRFSGLLQTLSSERQRAVDEGRDRMDSRVPLSPSLPDVLAHVRAVLEESDEYCRQGRLLSLPRSPELLAFATWTVEELVAQHAGAEPTPWPGPF